LQWQAAEGLESTASISFFAFQTEAARGKDQLERSMASSPSHSSAVKQATATAPAK